MAGFKAELPTELIKSFEQLEQNTDKMLKEMTQEGAKVVKQNAISKAPKYLKDKIKISVAYDTPSDGGKNTKVYISGYFYSKHNKKDIPAPLVANVLEYGKSNGRVKKSNGKSTGVMPKKPFFRRSFNKAQITSAMEKVEEKYLPKD